MLNKAQTHFVPFITTETQTAVSASGLFGFGLCALFLHLFQLGLFPVSVPVLAMGIFYGGMSQVTVGLMEWNKQNAFGGVTFIAYGLFWLSLVGFIALPEAGFGTAPQASVMSAYYFLWCAFTVLLLTTPARLSRAIRSVLGLLAGFFLTYCAGAAADAPQIIAASHYCGLVCGFAALYAGAALVVNQIYGRRILPGA